MSKKNSWKSHFSFYLLAIGSACGLGNLWRFPYVVGENGGGAFLLLYVLLSFTIGITLLISELMIGHFTKRGVLTASKRVSQQNKKPIYLFGWLSLLITSGTLAYYSVISGWVLHYLTQFVISLFSGTEYEFLSQLTNVSVLIQNGWLQFMLASVHLLFTVIIVLKGFVEGIERWISALLPVFGLLVFILLIRALSLDSNYQVLRFLFYPDFSKLSWASLGHAVGHVFFTLSLGFGAMVTFGSYFDDGEKLPYAGLRVTIINTIISVIAVLLIFPIAFTNSTQPLTDPSLLFEVLPKFLMSYKGGAFFGILFFLCLWLAALNASVGLLETIAANLQERKTNLTRKKAVEQAGIGLLIITIFPAYSGTIFRSVKILGRSLIEFLDLFLINWLLPIACLGMVLIALLGINDHDRRKHFVNPQDIATETMYSHWVFILKWVTPIVIVLGLGLQVVGIFRS